MSTPALILAAGAGRRFGAAPKQLAEVGGRPLLEHAVAAARAVDALGEVVVVLGARADEVRAGVDLGDARVVACEAWEEGQAASLRTGLAAVVAAGAESAATAQTRAEARGVVVLLGDQPFVTPAAIEAVLAAGPGARASYDGTPGHPAFLSPAHVEAARALRGDTGLRGASWRLVEVAHLASNRDVDTPHDLEEVRREARAVL